VQKYGADFAAPDTSLTGLMIALHHGQDAIADLLLQQEGSINQPSVEGLLPLDYLLQGYYKNIIYRHSFVASKSTLIKYWHIVRPASLSINIDNRRVTAGSHSMAFFLLVCMRCIQTELPGKVKVSFTDKSIPPRVAGVFTMNDVMRYVECMPEEILPEYRRQRQYVNSVLSLHETDSKSPYNKKLFKRVERGSYIVNPNLVFDQ